MATDYYDRFQNIAGQFWNSVALHPLKDSVLKVISFGRLHETVGWYFLSVLGIDTCRYKAIGVSAQNSSTGSYTPTGCGAYNLHYSDSLKMRPHCN